MPGFYHGEQYDLAGFAVGVVEEAHLLPRTHAMEAGDVVLGISSNGLHSNGYSLARKIVTDGDIQLDTPLPNDARQRSIGEALLAPTAIYVKPILALLEQHRDAIVGMVHMTGGGFQDNLPRVLPQHLGMSINLNSWTHCPLATFLGEQAQLSMATLLHTFNCGIGFTVVVKAAEAVQVQSTLSQLCEAHQWSVSRIGQLIQAKEAQPRIQFH
jgi:phosphoribosylaminoimidazole synthetase